MRVRGLKVSAEAYTKHGINVAPRAGAWIESTNLNQISAAVWSHPVRVRGLKDRQAGMVVQVKGSHPVRVRGLKAT